ncbi:MAG TPA: hypothetical protein VHN16_16180 [Streptosporangiaceae bacterium]|nr:hypothetical protein [Streptosporangiaceae bacterium]
MAVLYDVGLVLALLIGCAIGVLVTAGHYEQIALRRWTYEQEIAEGRELDAALAMFRRVKPEHPSDDKASVA